MWCVGVWVGVLNKMRGRESARVRACVCVCVCVSYMRRWRACARAHTHTHTGYIYSYICIHILQGDLHAALAHEKQKQQDIQATNIFYFFYLQP